MAKSFMSVLSSIEKTLDYEDANLYKKSVFHKLVSFVESGCYTSSEASKFILQNWRLSITELCRKYNNENIDEKSVHTIRSQLSTVSRQLWVLFPNIERAFYENDRDAQMQILSTIELISEGDEFFNDLFPREVLGYITDYDGNEYSLDELGAEINVLGKVTKQAILENLDLVDMNKLGYIQKVLQTPISSNRYRSVNTEKLAIMRRLSEIANTTDYTVAEPKVIAPADVNISSKYNVDSISELISAMEDYAEGVVDYGYLSERDQKFVKQAKRFYNLEGLKSLLNSVSKEAVACVLNQLSN